MSITVVIGSHMLPLLLSLLFLAASGMGVAASTATPAPGTPGDREELRSGTGAILRGQGATARTILLSVPEGALDPKDRRFRACALSRLSPITSPVASLGNGGNAEPFADRLLALYRTYWWASAVSETDRPAAEQALVSGLSKLLGRSRLRDVNDAEPLIAVRLRTAGLFSQEGRTGVFHDLMIWNREGKRVERVALPEGDASVHVTYLNDFLGRGWSRYLSCDRTGTGGWTTNDGTFVVVPSYDSLTDEYFRVNLLAHEGQIHLDKGRFKDLPAWRLEYRAKLAELASVDTTRDRVIDNFISNRGNDPAEPHSYADQQILAVMTSRLRLSSEQGLRDVALNRLHEAATDELRADGGRLRRAASSTSQ